MVMGAAKIIIREGAQYLNTIFLCLVKLFVINQNKVQRLQSYIVLISK